MSDLEGVMDSDIESMSKEQLVAEVKKLRAGIREHRDCSGHDLCWYHPHLWSLLPEKTDNTVQIPAWPQFMRGCIKYRHSLDEQLPQASRTEKEFGE
jgi:hypothetical protein